VGGPSAGPAHSSASGGGAGCRRWVPGAAQAVTGQLNVGAVLARRDEIIGGLDDSGQVSWLGNRIQRRRGDPGAG